MQPTSQMIDSQISALDRNLLSLRGHADALSLGAVTGNRAAAEELARVKSEIAGLVADREVLEAARRRALVLEADAAEDAGIEERAAARAEASAAVQRLLKAARRADAMTKEWQALASEMALAEAAARDAARRAGGILMDARVGQYGLIGHAMDLMTRTANGSIKANNPMRGCEDFVVGGWRELLEEETADA